MLCDYPRPFLFIHIPKTAGTSVETALVSSLLGIESLAEVDPETADRHALPGGLRHVTGFPFRIRSAVVQHECVEYFEHLGLLNNRTVFSVVRNPYDRALSQILYLLRTDPVATTLFQGPTWPDDLKTLARLDDARVHDLAACQIDWLLDAGGKLRCDRIMRFESLAEDWAGLCDELGLAETDLPHINRTRHDFPWWEYYDEEAADGIARKFARDFDTLGYDAKLPQTAECIRKDRVLWLGGGTPPEQVIRHPYRSRQGRLELPDHSVGTLHLYGCLETLSPVDARNLLGECRRILLPGGTLMVNTLDLDFIASLLPRAYEPGTIEFDFVRSYVDNHLPDVEEYAPAYVINDLVRRKGQVFLYDEALLAEMLSDAGFEGERQPDGPLGEISVKAR